MAQVTDGVYWIPPESGIDWEAPKLADIQKWGIPITQAFMREDTMADRTILDYEELRLEYGPHWSLNIERSSSGEPTILMTITHMAHDGKAYPTEQMTIVVEDAPTVLAPLIKWLEAKNEA